MIGLEQYNMEDKVLKHLEFIQNTINRMSTNSFIIKGWAITLIGVIISFTEIEGIYLFYNSTYNFPIEMVILLLVIVLFWSFNAYFLQQERRYISIYTKTIEQFNSNNSLILDMTFENYYPSSSNKCIYWICSILCFLGSIICAKLIDEMIIKIILSVALFFLSIFFITYVLSKNQLCKYWTCFIGRTIISIYGTMIILLLLVNHSMFNSLSKKIISKPICECQIKSLKS